jgi:hypothetical protein
MYLIFHLRDPTICAEDSPFMPPEVLAKAFNLLELPDADQGTTLLQVSI